MQIVCVGSHDHGGLFELNAGARRRSDWSITLPDGWLAEGIASILLSSLSSWKPRVRAL
jgi:hypothetical protein